MQSSSSDPAMMMGGRVVGRDSPLDGRRKADPRGDSAIALTIAALGASVRWAVSRRLMARCSGGGRLVFTVLFVVSAPAEAIFVFLVSVMFARSKLTWSTT